MPFDEVLERIEKLGTKNEVKVRFNIYTQQYLFTPAEMQIVYTTIWISMSDRLWQIWLRNSTCVTDRMHSHTHACDYSDH